MKRAMTSRIADSGAQSERHDALVARGTRLYREKRFKEAEFCFQSVLLKNPQNADALHMMGVLAMAEKNAQLSVDFLRKAVRQNPRHATYHNHLGVALLETNSPAEAATHLKRAMALDRNIPEPVYNLGRTHKALGNLGLSKKFFEKVLKIDPDFLRAYAALGQLEYESGKFEEAATRFEQILQKDPQNVAAMAGLSMSRKVGPDDPVIKLIEKHLVDPNTEKAQRVHLHYAMGKISNDMGAYDKAFQHFAHGKQYAGAFFNMVLHRKTYAMLRNTFSAEFFVARTGFGVDDERPVFIVGMPRSGTTLTEQIIASHHLIHGLGERPEIREIAAHLNFGEPDPNVFSKTVSGLENREVEKFARQYLKLYEDAPNGMARVSDKNPHNSEMLGLIALIYPKARIIHCLRDPMDTCVSCYMQAFKNSHGYNADLATLGHYYVEYKRLMDHWRNVLPLKMFELQYEDMIADQEGMSRKLIDFLGLDWDDACLNYFEAKRSVDTPSVWQVRQPIYKSAVGRWKRYGRQLDPLKSALGDLFSENA